MRSYFFALCLLLLASIACVACWHCHSSAIVYSLWRALSHRHRHRHTQTPPPPPTHTHTQEMECFVMHACVSRWSWRVSVWSVCFNWREACLLSWRTNRKHDGRVSQRYRFKSRRGEWALCSLMPSALSSVFLWHTHTHTHARTFSFLYTLPVYVRVWLSSRLSWRLFWSVRHSWRSFRSIRQSASFSLLLLFFPLCTGPGTHCHP